MWELPIPSSAVARPIMIIRMLMVVEGLTAPLTAIGSNGQILVPLDIHA